MAESDRNLKDFERSLLRLEQIVSDLEEGDSTLEELLKLYEEGSLLAKGLQKNLDDAQKRLDKLTEETKKDNKD